MKKNKVPYFLATGLMTLMFVASGTMTLVDPPHIHEMFHSLSVPGHMRILFGLCKLGGLIFLWWPKTSAKLWAYHGYTFLMGGAIYMHLSVGQPIVQAAPACLGLALSLASYALWSQVEAESKNKLSQL